VADKTIKLGIVRVSEKGGAGSGNWGHAGRPGVLGGSSSGRGMGAAMARSAEIKSAVASVSSAFRGTILEFFSDASDAGSLQGSVQKDLYVEGSSSQRRFDNGMQEYKKAGVVQDAGAEYKLTKLGRHVARHVFSGDR